WRSIPKTNWPWRPPGHTASGAVRTGECNHEMPGSRLRRDKLPYPAFRRLNAEPGDGEPSFCSAGVLTRVLETERTNRGWGHPRYSLEKLAALAFNSQDELAVATSGSHNLRRRSSGGMPSRNAGLPPSPGQVA